MSFGVMKQFVLTYLSLKVSDVVCQDLTDHYPIQQNILITLLLAKKSKFIDIEKVMFWNIAKS